MQPEVLALIPARGGSKSVPRKNLLRVAGAPLISYSIEHALESAWITRTIVSTDDAEIAQIARDCGAEVPFIRPDEFASDTATDLDVFAHALTWLEDHEGYVPDAIVHLRPTGPIRDVAVVDRAIVCLLEDGNADSLRAVGLAEQTPYKMWTVEEPYLKPLMTLDGVAEAHSMPRQSLPSVYWQNGYVDIVRARTIVEKKSMCGDVILPFIIHGPIHELDYPEQIFALESALLAHKQSPRNLEPFRCSRYPS